MILLTALPRTGKSTAIKKIVNMLGKDNCGGFYTEEIREDGERVGFRICTLSGKTGILSHVNIESDYRISRYGVDLETFERLCVSELESATKDNNVKYIVIDEIGPMQLFSEKYKALLISLLNCDKPIIGTIFMNPYEWLDDFKKQKNVNLIEITFDNRDSLPLQLVELLSKNDEQFQRKIAKAKKYSTELDRFELLDDRIIIHSEHGIRTVKKENDKYICDCEFYQTNHTCSHIMAIININLSFDNENVKNIN
ncbi:MAG: nucleoside-triphosphatase [Bacilli bacterium]|nr:nucleoside-triphosphatase [Bacilli bacterium]